jgi:hypothetical protein
MERADVIESRFGDEKTRTESQRVDLAISRIVTKPYVAPRPEAERED